MARAFDPDYKPEPMEAAWDRMSVDYGERLRLSPDRAHYSELAACVPETNAPLRLLDLGCGLGYQLDSIFKRAPNARVLALDVSGKMLAGLRARLSAYTSQIETRQASYVDGEWPDARFDFATAVLTVHHLIRETKLGLYEHIVRGLKPGGRYLQSDEVNSPEMKRRGRELYESHIEGRPGAARGDWNHNMAFTIENEQALMLEAGFASVEVPWKAVNDAGKGLALFVASVG